MAQNLTLVILEIWSLCILVFAAHRIRPRYGLTLLLSLIVGLTVLLQTPVIAVNYISIGDDFLLILGTTVLVPAILIAVLILYVLDGTFVARQMIYGILGVTLVSILISRLFLLNLSLPGGGNWFAIPVDAPIYSFNLRQTVSSFLTFAVDLYVIVIMYQALTNHLPRIPGWLRAGLALLTALISDTVFFSLFSGGVTGSFFLMIADDLFTRLAAGLVTWPLLALYMGVIVPRSADAGRYDHRPTFDLLSGSLAQMEAALREAEQASQRSQRDVQSLWSLIGDTSHDLKQPVTVIKMRLHMLGMGESDIQRVQYIRSIEEQTGRLEVMIEDLLMLSRLDEIEELRTELMDLNQIAQVAVEHSQASLTRKNQSFEVRLAESLPPVPVNTADMLRAIINLIENSSRYTPEGGKIEVETRAGPTGASIQISDTGIGIAEADIPHIFERFYRASQVVDANLPGTGLGLAIVKKVVDKHRGRIEVSSTVNEGTTFVIHVPMTST